MMSHEPGSPVPKDLTDSAKRLSGVALQIEGLASQVTDDGVIPARLASFLERLDKEIAFLDERLKSLLKDYARAATIEQGAVGKTLALAGQKLKEFCAALKGKKNLGEFSAAFKEVDQAAQSVKQLSAKVTVAPTKSQDKPPRAADEAASTAKKRRRQAAQSLTSEIASLGFLVSELKGLAAHPDRADFAKLIERVSAQWEKVLALANKATTKRSTITQFFDSIATGFVEAQENLDRASEKYARRALALPPPEPAKAGTAPLSSRPPMATLFRIPKLTAELKCSFETTREKKLNVVFYSDRNDVRELHQQTVHVEFLAVPAPPEYLRSLAQQGKGKPSE